MKDYFQTLINWLTRIKAYGLRNSIIIYFSLKKDKLFTLKHNGYKFYLRGNTVDFDVFNGIFTKNEYSFNIPHRSIEYIVDAGAFIGASTVFFKLRFPEAKIIAVEPEKTNYELLKKNTSSYDNIYNVNGGVWFIDADLEIKNYKVPKYAFQVQECTNNNLIKIPGWSLESLLRQFHFPYIDLLKIDIEGAEKILFNNKIIPVLRKTRLIIIELHDSISPGSSKAFFETLKILDYDLSVSGESIIIHNKSFKCN